MILKGYNIIVYEKRKAVKMNVEKLTKQDVILIDLIKKRVSNVEKIKPHLLNEFLSKLDDFECETRKYLC